MSEPTMWEAVKTKLHTDNRYTRFLEKLEECCRIKRESIFIILVTILGIYLSVGRGAEIICNLCGAIYPICASIKAIEKKHTHIMKRLLVYWVIFASFKLLEFFSIFLIAWIPFYWALKVVILVACFAPTKDNISTHIYDKLIEPFMKEMVKISKGNDDPSTKSENPDDSAFPDE